MTGEFIAKAIVKKPGLLSQTTIDDILKIVVIERHKATGRIGKAFVRGFGLKQGAIGSTVAHDSHNIVIVGTNDADMFAAFQQIKKLKGGLVVINNGKLVAQLPLPVGGLLSAKSFEETAADLKNLKQKVKTLGGTHDSPFMILSFLCLSAIPKLKVTDLGLIDVEKFKITLYLLIELKTINNPGASRCQRLPTLRVTAFGKITQHGVPSALVIFYLGMLPSTPST